MHNVLIDFNVGLEAENYSEASTFGMAFISLYKSSVVEVSHAILGI